jgi:hypothetical protein
LWKYQVVEYNGKSYYLTRLGFGLNVAPKIMSAIVNHVLSLDSKVRAGTDSYVDDIIVNNDVVPCERVVAHLQEFGLACKKPESLNGGRVLGLRVEKSGDIFVWKRDNVVDAVSDHMTKRQLFSWTGQLVGHFPVAGWLRPACSYIKRMSNDVDWEEEVGSHVLRMARELQCRVDQCDPVGGIWNVPENSEVKVWCDASSLAIGTCLEIGGVVVEDACWLRKSNDNSHINLAELESIVRGLNLAILWGVKNIEIVNDSSTVCGWLQSLITGDKPVRVKGLGEALARRRLSLIESLMKECELTVSVTLVKSNENIADKLTRVPQNWLTTKFNQCALGVQDNHQEMDLRGFHELHHLGIDKTWYLVKKCFPGIDIKRNEVQKVVETCVRCKSIDPTPVKWEEGDLEVATVWDRVACDVTHYGDAKYLTMVDCGPSRFALWRRIPNEKDIVITEQFDEVFHERGPPGQLLLDNSATFRSEAVRQLCREWSVELIFRCAYRPSGNGIVERNHRTIKRMAARSGGDILRMVYWYNMSPRSKIDEKTIPSHLLFSYSWKSPTVIKSTGKKTTGASKFLAGQDVFVKPANAKCTTPWPTGVVTGSHGGVQVEVDGVPRHVADVRSVPMVRNDEDDEDIKVNIRPECLHHLPMQYTDYVL